MKYNNEYYGLETSDEIIQAIEEKHSGRACDEGSDAWHEWSDPEDLDGIVTRAWEIAGSGENKLFWGVEKFTRCEVENEKGWWEEFDKLINDPES